MKPIAADHASTAVIANKYVRRFITCLLDIRNDTVIGVERTAVAMAECGHSQMLSRAPVRDDTGCMKAARKT